MSTDTADNFRVPPRIARDIVTASAYGGDRRIDRSLRWLRAHNPVGRVETEGYDPFWIVTKHADLLEVSRQNALFHSGDRAIFLMDTASVQRNLAITGRPNPFYSIVTMDGLEHQKIRLLTQAWFMPQQVARRTESIRRIARSTVENMLAKGGECEFVADVALHYPLRVIMGIMGAPDEDTALVLRLTKQLLGVDDPDLGRGEDNANFAEGFSNVLHDFHSYFREIIAARRRNPQDDVASIIANGTIDGQLLEEESILGYYLAIATAGHDTTSSSTAGAMWGLAQSPREFAKVRNDPALIPALVEEAIRWTTPVQHFMRSATADAELRGRRISRGDWLMLSYTSGNQDEEVFDDPLAFRVDRKPNPQLAFGYGAHMCLGMHLARLEMRILFEELLPHLESLELGGEPRRAEINFIGGAKYLPLRFHAC